MRARRGRHAAAAARRRLDAVRQDARDGARRAPVPRDHRVAAGRQRRRTRPCDSARMSPATLTPVGDHGAARRRDDRLDDRARRRPAGHGHRRGNPLRAPPARGGSTWSDDGREPAPRLGGRARGRRARPDRDARGPAPRARIARAVRDRPVFTAASIYFALGLVTDSARGSPGSSCSRRRRSSSCSCCPTSRARRCTRSAAGRRSSRATASTSCGASSRAGRSCSTT